ncbi:ribonuclease H-like domain-containing protein [Tanacetum coccineum]
MLWRDDIILTASSAALLQRIVALLHSMFLSQSKFAEEILERAHMQNCNSYRTPVDTESKLGSNVELVNKPTLCRSLAVALQHLTFTRPNLSYVVQQLHVSSTAQLTAYIEVKVINSVRRGMAAWLSLTPLRAMAIHGFF